VLISRFLFDLPGSPADTLMHLLIYAAATCFAGLLLVPVAGCSDIRNLSALMARIAAATMVFIIIAAADPQTRSAVEQFAPLALFVFMLLLAALLQVQIMSVKTKHARELVFVIFAVLFATPVWLAPLAELAAQWPAVPDLIVAMSPLTTLAVSLDLDYLRTNWFYQYSVLGSLRFEYLSWSAYLLGLTVIIAAQLVVAVRAVSHRTLIAGNDILDQPKNGVTTS
jgi:hypothetical protein